MKKIIGNKDEEKENSTHIIEIVEIDGVVDISREGDYLVIQSGKILVN